MKYSQLITKNKQYRYSANVCFDLDNAAKLGDFIPNETTTEILREYLGGIISGNSPVHSRILYGSYGTGKSHLLTVLGSVLAHNNAKTSEFKSFVSVIRNYDPELASDINKFSKEKKPFLVVPIYTDHNSFNDCITYSLKRELTNVGIPVTFTGFFNEARSLVDNWEKHKESKRKLQEECSKNGISLSALKTGLETYNEKYGVLFQKIYNGISYGATFNASSGNLIDNIEKAYQKIHDKYRGIVFIFDEFGRYIEDNGNGIKVKEIQDLAEYCDHSGTETHLILVSHKQLSLYIESFKKSLSEEWKKVEGRFKPTSINMKYDQCLSLIGSIIPKTTKWEDFKHNYSSELNDLYNQAWDFKGFMISGSVSEKNPFEDGFPLHPITLYSLDRLSKKVAQNERTFFTYLAGDEEFSLFSQLQELNTSEFHFIGLDSIYDYFEFNIRAYKTGESYEVYKKLQYAINKLGTINDVTSIKVLKAMAVIAIIGDTNIIVNNKKTLSSVIDVNPRVIADTIDKLEEMKVIKFMRQYGYYEFFDSSIFDLDGMIEEKISGIHDEMIVSVLNEDFCNFILYPYEYNEAYKMHRVFLPVFARKEDLGKKSVLSTLPKYYDGVVVMVLDDKSLPADYADCDCPHRSIVIVNSESKNLEYEVRRYIAIQYFNSIKHELAKDDPAIINEIALYLNEQKSIIDECIENWRRLVTDSLFVVINGMQVTVNSEKDLSHEASKLLFDVFPKTIVVNNDIINKNNVSGAIKLARNKALDSIIGQEDFIGSVPFLSPEYNILRSVIYKNGLIDASKQERINLLPDGSCAGKAVLAEINKFLRQAEKGQVPLSSIYSKLKSEPYGLRDGYLSVLFAFALRHYQNVSLYFHGTEHDYNSEELVRALTESDDYSLYICNWDDEKNSYISSLERIFTEFIVDTAGTNRLKRLYDAMMSHYSSISKCARTTEQFVSDSTKKYREILNYTHNDYNKFFFETLLEIDGNFTELDTRIKNIKAELENVPNLIYSVVNKATREILGVPEKQMIVDCVQSKYIKEWKRKKVKAFDYLTNSFLDIASTSDGDSDDLFVKALSKLLTGFEIDYWTDNKVEDFEEALREIINKINGYTPKANVSSGEIKLTIQDGTQNPFVTQFNDIELSNKGTMMLNKLKSTIDNFGESVSYEERLNIISRLLKEVLNPDAML